MKERKKGPKKRSKGKRKGEKAPSKPEPKGDIDPETFIERFEPGLNKFSISITKVFPPEVKTKWAKKAYLIKLRMVLNMPADDWKYFTRLADTIKRGKMFCGIWTPELGDVVIDDYGCYIEMISYIQTGTEDKLVHLDGVIRASPKFGVGTQLTALQEKETKFVETFVEMVRSGDGLEKAMERTKEAVPVESEEPVEALNEGQYLIGKTVVVRGGVADKLHKADKKVEDEIDDEDEEG